MLRHCFFLQKSFFLIFASALFLRPSDTFHSLSRVVCVCIQSLESFAHRKKIKRASIFFRSDLCHWLKCISVISAVHCCSTNLGAKCSHWVPTLPRHHHHHHQSPLLCSWQILTHCGLIMQIRASWLTHWARGD